MKRLRVCIVQGCPELTRDRRCEAHTRAYAEAHVSDFRWVYVSRRWQGLRRQVLREEVLCAVDSCREFAMEVDHIIPMTQGGPPFDRLNVQGLCKHHHSSKTANEVWHHR